MYSIVARHSGELAGLQKGGPNVDYSLNLLECLKTNGPDPKGVVHPGRCHRPLQSDRKMNGQEIVGMNLQQIRPLETIEHWICMSQSHLPLLYFPAYLSPALESLASSASHRHQSEQVVQMLKDEWNRQTA